MALIVNRSARLPGLDIREPATAEFLYPAVQSQDLKAELRALQADLRRRFEMEQRLEKESQVPLISVPDFMIENPALEPALIIRQVCNSPAFYDLIHQVSEARR